MRGRPATREERLAALGLWALAFLALLWGERSVGFVRDESVYFEAARSYAGWFRLLARAPAEALGDAAIVRFFDVNHEHPVLMKVLFGLSHLTFHEWLGWVRPATAFRLPAFAVAALVPALVYLLGAAVSGRRAALFAALSFLLVPRQYFNAELACFDLPVAAAWLLVVYCFWRALEDVRWGVLTGVAFGLALATKHNALFLPFVLAPFGLWAAWRASRGEAPARALALRAVGLVLGVGLLYGVMWIALGPEGFQRRFLWLSPHVALFVALAAGGAWLARGLWRASPGTARALVPLLAMAVLGPVLFYLHWPYLWHHPVDRTAWYLAFHAQHNHYAWFYLGEMLRAPPFPLTYVLVKTALTVPLSLFAPMVTGLLALAWRAARRRASLAEWLVGVNALASIAIISHPDVPHFGGVKHWLPSMPFLALLAGEAVARAGTLATERLPRRARAWGLGALFALLLAPALWGLVRVHPYGTSFYAETAGGVPGAASLGMQRQFWSNNVTGVLPWINAHAPRGARLWLHEVNGYSFRDYQENGMLRPDLVGVGGPEAADLAAYQYHQEFREHELDIWRAFGTRTPVFGLYLDETPQVVVYQRP